MSSRFGTVALGVAGITLVARIFGFGRWLVFSKTVGDTCLGDVYNAANTLPNVLFEIVAGGVLAGVVIPVLARHVGGQRRTEASQTTSALLTWTMIILTPAGLAALLGASLYGAAFAKPTCEGSAATVAALLVMFVPQIWLYGLAVVSAGVLQAHSRFLAAALAPLVSSAVVIASYLAFLGTAAPNAQDDLAQLNRSALVILGWGTTLGVLALALTTVIPMARLGHRLRPRLGFAAGDRAVIGRIAVAGIAGLVLQQLSLLVINWSAQQTGDQGALTRFTWANAIYLLPYAVLVAPLLQVAFPQLATAAEEGASAVAEVLDEVGPQVIMLASLGAALLVGTAVPVARVFVLGPGSGDTAALAWLIAMLAPAVVGFGVLGLSSRTLLAQHRAGAAGAVTVAAWSVVILAALGSRVLIPVNWQVVALAAAVSLGMCAGGVVGAVLARRASEQPTTRSRFGRSTLISLFAAGVAGGLVAWPTMLLRDADLLAATVGAIGAAVLCVMIFVGVVFLVDRNLGATLWNLVRRRSAMVDRS
ncbi:MAG TPA: lipid II flippase MurJ [Propionibacteriaceae bacterium]|nr:lipid II flippase MurJ [Propionibacteriaceae bacterium]